MFWFNWLFWRTKLGQYFNTCARCMKPTPFGIGKTILLCNACDRELVEQFSQRTKQK